jgi:dienelactone hydrolase
MIRRPDFELFIVLQGERIRVSIEPVEFEIGSDSYEGRVNLPESDADTDAGVLMIPGAGHGPYGNIFDIVAYELAGTGKRVFRYESWESHEELDEKTVGELHEEVDAAVERLRSNGCSTIHLIAKSFGGGIALTHVPDAVDSAVLWAPAVELSDESAVERDPDEKLGDSDGLVFEVGTRDLEAIDLSVRILVGDEDEGVPVDQCQRIADAVEDGDVTVIPGENHSFNENRTAIVDKTLEHLADEP